LMLECPEKIIGGAKILMRATGTEHMTIAIENNKPDAVELLTQMTKEYDNISVQPLKTKYPQGDERQLMFVIKGVELPAGKLPADVGCVIFNAETCVSVYKAVYEGMPLIETSLTVDGDAVNEPKNILAPVGTTVSDVLAFCGGAKENLVKIVSGGPMMGQAQWDMNAVVMKNTSAFLFLSDKTQSNYEGDCIHCGRCVGVCPMHLMPNYLASFSKKDDRVMAEEFGILSCVECGSCTYICPGNVPIVQYIRTTKGAILADKKKAAMKAKESEAKS
ncbi:MAG: RnfABCDGE type electron transport complex subunit C, partial [Clostridia bacterium]|nr:RnfABCDGE type electron transport complex subunit C [Clostridia bacterium]